MQRRMESYMEDETTSPRPAVLPETRWKCTGYVPSRRRPRPTSATLCSLTSRNDSAAMMCAPTRASPARMRMLCVSSPTSARSMSRASPRGEPQCMCFRGASSCRVVVPAPLATRTRSEKDGSKSDDATTTSSPACAGRESLRSSVVVPGSARVLSVVQMRWLVLLPYSIKEPCSSTMIPGAFHWEHSCGPEVKMLSTTMSAWEVKGAVSDPRMKAPLPFTTMHPTAREKLVLAVSTAVPDNSIHS
mmetsp:Transcript_9782/g.24437  ORF Transcript_9782/g.24437 Transcript_9782/m.24437 type:complete len:246 (+) Transcript_9782:1764-2501(+)